MKTARLTPPPETALYSNSTYRVHLKTFDRFNNPIAHGGLPVAARLQLIKSGVHDLTTLMPTNHAIEIEDNDDGTYHVLVTLIKIAVSVKVIVNMDKNIPASGGELPAMQLTFLADPGTATPAEAAPTSVEEPGQATPSAEAEDATGRSTSTPPATDNARLRAAGQEIVTLMGVPEKPKATVAVVAEVFAEAGKKQQQRKRAAAPLKSQASVQFKDGDALAAVVAYATTAPAVAGGEDDDIGVE